MASAVDTRIPVLDGTLTLAVKIWYPPSVKFGAVNTIKSIDRTSTRRVCIAYPGWLDNAGSFDNIAPLLCERLDLVIAVVDPPGCGWSDHRAAQSPYADYEEPPLIGDIADFLGWQTFGLLGHSRGGAICAFAAALFPSRVLFFIAFDSGLGLSGVWMKDLKAGAPSPVQRMRMARDQHSRNRQRPTKVFASLEDAVEANANNEVFKKSRSTARNIVMRHIRPHPSGGYTFTHDGRTYGQSQYLCMTEDQTRAFLSEITCRVLKINCKPEETRYPRDMQEYFAARTKCVKNLENCIVPGDHHVHSDDAPAVAEAVIQWFAVRDPFVFDLSSKL